MKKNLLQNIALLAIVLFMTSCTKSITEGSTPEDAIVAFQKALDVIDSDEAADAFRAKAVDFNGNPLDYEWDAVQRNIDFLKKNGGYDHAECYFADEWKSDKEEFCDSIVRYEVVVFAKNGTYGKGFINLLKKGNKYIAWPYVYKSEGFFKLDKASYRSVLGRYENALRRIYKDKSKLPEYNQFLFGKFSNFQDPSVEMEIYSQPAPEENFNNAKVYGTIAVANEYFEYEYIMYVTAIKPDGCNLIADVTITQLQGDMEEGDFSYPVKGKAKVKIIYDGYGIIKIEGCDKIPVKTLYKEGMSGKPLVDL